LVVAEPFKRMILIEPYILCIKLIVFDGLPHDEKNEVVYPSFQIILIINNGWQRSSNSNPALLRFAVLLSGCKDLHHNCHTGLHNKLRQSLSPVSIKCG
jgi:hypothetical protein